MVLNQKQKKYVFTQILSKKDLVKLFETTNLEWLCKQKVEIKNEDAQGWKELWCDKELITKLNFPLCPGWQTALDDIDNMEQCQWCEDWFPKDEMVFKKKGFTKLCDICDRYLASREGKGGY